MFSACSPAVVSVRPSAVVSVRPIAPSPRHVWVSAGYARGRGGYRQEMVIGLCLVAATKDM